MGNHWFRATTPKQLTICLKMLYAKNVPFSVRVIENDKRRIEYRIEAIASEAELVDLQELYRILIS